MNCEEYRDAIAADPSETFEGGRVHAAACEKCREYRRDMLSLDERIARALTIDVPPLQMPELPPYDASDGDVVDIAGTGPRRPLLRMSLPLWAGIAAGLALVAVLVTGIPGGGNDGEALARQVMAHMDHEQESRQVTSVPVSTQTLGDVVDPKVSAMDPDIGLISYAMSCVINGNTVPHLVIQGRAGPVTLILLPDETIEASIPLSGENVHGVILPVGNGSVAIIGQREDQQDEIEEIGRKLAGSVKWNI
jgi:Protein of unknown function (DUF3379)